ncbi:tetratricopeptide repeat protein, partial [Spirulina sp. 06S082]|uniref:tetratricopeptide repeat protein n=1 Tax=Spirulina sp. 06S082 TaxID=3110248 RepID=UPI002B213DF8
MGKKKKGFGKKKEIPTRKTRDFMLALQERIVKNDAKSTKVYQFVEAKLDESLLEALPLVFNQLIAKKTSREQQNIARLFGNFGNLLQEFPRGDRQLNLEVSIMAYELARKVFTRETFPQDWATVQNNLGIVYSERIRGQRADNLEEAIAAYELALQVRTREAFPQDWAATQNNLGEAYRNRIRGERADNLEKAISFYELALQVKTRETFPQDWAVTQNNLASAYS